MEIEVESKIEFRGALSARCVALLVRFRFVCEQVVLGEVRLDLTFIEYAVLFGFSVDRRDTETLCRSPSSLTDASPLSASPIPPSRSISS